MRKLMAGLFAAAVLVGGIADGADASHKSRSKHAPAPPQDCAVEVDPLGVCLG